MSEGVPSPLPWRGGIGTPRLGESERIGFGIHGDKVPDMILMPHGRRGCKCHNPAGRRYASNFGSAQNPSLPHGPATRGEVR